MLDGLGSGRVLFVACVRMDIDGAGRTRFSKRQSDHLPLVAVRVVGAEVL